MKLTQIQKELLAKAIAEKIIELLEASGFDFTDIVNTKAVKLVSSIHKVLCRYGYDENYDFDNPENNPAIDFCAIEDIVRLFEEDGLDSGVIHDFG